MAKRKPKGTNSRGRPKESYGEFRKAVREQGDKLIKIAIKAAEDGDSTMLKYLLECILPKLRPQTVPFQVDSKSTNVSDIGEAILLAGLKGDTSSDVVRDFMAALADAVKIREITIIEERLSALEKGEDKPPWEVEGVVVEKLPLRGKKRRGLSIE